MRRLVGFVALGLLFACAQSGRRPAEPGPGAPERFLGVTEEGAIVVARATDGRVERAVLDDPAFRVGTVQLLDDGDTVYASGRLDEGCARVVRLSLRGGPPEEVVARTEAWNVSGDGRFLAHAEGATCGGARTVAVRDLATGSERRWEAPPDPPGSYGFELAGVMFLADPRYLYFFTCGVDSCGPTLLDTKLDSKLDGAHDPAAKGAPADPDYGGTVGFGAATLRGDSLLVFAARFGDIACGQTTYPVFEIDPLSRGVRETLLRFPPSPGCAGSVVGGLDFDPSGEHMLFLREGVLYRWSGGEPVRISSGFVSAHW